MEDSMGMRIKYLRQKHNFTQREVGEFLDISQSLLAKVESNERNLDITKILKLCDLFNVSEEYLIFGKGNYDKNTIAFRKDNKSINLKTIARMNRIINNLKYMKELYEENYTDD
ncbi:helix-turn-helix domain-containing protein [Methanosphaera sp. BMS]|uniref:helix-turn-helix domain-containing protein n=1 Tax=Methanosphaera sp. BMS TaxID=1789762 RepID=UPI000DC1D7A2|nr:helix-turn-helix transcriptional regulator [Methanosphaera sp. BMS]AWX31803.1 hypothetical protein AW729_01285 [Methanosphaera sp. BMS]